jgi:hypothetical protein
MSFEQVYLLDPPDTQTVRASWQDGVDLEPVLCSENEGHVRSGKRIGDLRIEVPSPQLEDFVWTWYSECLAQETTVSYLRDAGITGFETRNIASVKSRGSDLTSPGLVELIVVGWAGMAKPDSGIRLVKQYLCCGYKKYSAITSPQDLIDWSKWDGSDIFMIWPLPRYILVTERVVEVLRKHSLTGYVARSLDWLRRTEGFTPGRLSNYMPIERAKEVGEPLGIF